MTPDCKTDVVFNTLSLIFPLIGHQLSIWWLDPVGAGLLSLFIIYDWAGTCLENVIRLSGSAIDDRLLQKIVFLAWRFAPIVSAYKTITAYHAGDGVWVEIDVLLDPKTPLDKAHDVAETLQYCLEGKTCSMPAMTTAESGIQSRFERSRSRVCYYRLYVVQSSAFIPARLIILLRHC